MSQLSRHEQERLVQQIYGFAAQRMREGYSNFQIVRELEQQGLNATDAQTVVDRLSAARNNAQREAAFKAMGVGALICIVGIVVTLATYNSAKGGGTYVVAYGAILGGGFQFLRGVYYLMTG